MKIFYFQIKLALYRFQDKKLDGDNQYFCSHCQSKQNATRRIKLKKIPDVLNLQLLRFVFDRYHFFKKNHESICFLQILIDENVIDLEIQDYSIPF